MIQWCAYCQTFLREEAPFDRYEISYGVCTACRPNIQAFSAADQEGLEASVAFFIRLEDLSLVGTHAEVAKILDEGLHLGVRPTDLMMGMLQPLLTKIGELWAANKITVATEHRFSAFVADLVAQVRISSGPEVPPASPALLLVTAEENYHTLGVQMADAYFATQGIPTLAMTPGLPTKEIIDLLDLHRPLALGFSVALPSQMKQVEEVVRRTRGLPWRQLTS